jgi:phytol kinase
MLSNIWLALIITLVLALGWLRLNDALAHRGVMSGPLSRKIIHIGTGPIFVLCWLLFPEVPYARYVAALVPLGITAQFALVGLGIMKDPSAVSAMTRHGDRREILRGPLFYGIVFVIITIIFWRESPIGIVALMLLCGGDGLADILGKRYGVKKLPWSTGKSWVGSFGMFIGGWLLALFVLGVYVSTGWLPGPVPIYLAPVTIIAFVGTLVESIPVQDIDNITVPLVAVLLGYFLF